MEEETNIQGENILNEEAENELKNEILIQAIRDWINTFTGVFAALDLTKITGKKRNLFLSGKGEFLKMLWEQYPDFKKDIILEMEGEYPELKEMRISFEKVNEILKEVYDFAENSKDETYEFKNKIGEFYDKLDEQKNIFLNNKNILNKNTLEKNSKISL